MKRTVTLLTLVLLTFAIHGQNQFECDFGLTRDQVWNFISSKDFINAENSSDNLITASNGDLKIQYHFYAGRLYKIETLKTYSQKVDAEETYAGLKSMFQVSRARVRELPAERGNAVFTAMDGVKSCEVHQIKEAKTFAILQISTHAQFGPQVGQMASARTLIR